ncbi:MAG: YaaR family protein [Spirochaetia bacterium]
MSKIRFDRTPSFKGKRKSSAGSQPNLKAQHASSFKEYIDQPENYNTTEDAAVFSSEIGSLEEILDSIHSLGEELKRSQTMATVRLYRNAVKNFLKKISEAYEVEQQISGNNILKRKQFTLIKIADEELERLGAGILQSQRDQLEILAKIDEIYGMLLNLLQ